MKIVGQDIGMMESKKKKNSNHSGKEEAWVIKNYHQIKDRSKQNRIGGLLEDGKKG